VYLFLIVFLLQDLEPAPGTPSFTPITPGNVITLGDYSMTVPDGFFLASEEDAPNMFELVNATFIPSCAGIFFASSGDWSYCGIIQHFPNQAYVPEPVLNLRVFDIIYRDKHLFTMKPFQGTTEVILPPRLDKEQGTVEVGVHYQTDIKSQSGVYIKKAWVNGHEAVMLSIRASSFENYLKNEEDILSLLDTVSTAVPTKPPTEKATLSYYRLFGVGEPKPVGEASAEDLLPAEMLASNGISKQVIAFSVVSALFGIIVLLVAWNLSRKAKAKTDEAE